MGLPFLMNATFQNR